MTSPVVDTGIVAFIEARLDERERRARQTRTWDPHGAPRRIAEVAKDRAILALHRSDDDLPDMAYCTECDQPYPCQTVRLLAATDADHPSFRPEWKPVAT